MASLALQNAAKALPKQLWTVADIAPGIAASLTPREFARTTARAEF